MEFTYSPCKHALVAEIFVLKILKFSTNNFFIMKPNSCKGKKYIYFLNVQVYSIFHMKSSKLIIYLTDMC